jgi:hypothetical protein
MKMRFSGYLSTLDDPEARVRARVLVGDGEIDLETDSETFGQWSLAEVRVIQIGEKVFKLVVADETVLFEPSTPTAFGRATNSIEDRGLTDRVRAAAPQRPPAMQEATPEPSDRMRNTHAVIIGGAALLTFVGSFLPWASLGIFSVSGTDGDGILTLGTSVVAAIGILVGFVNQRRRVGAVVALIANVGAFAVGVNMISNFAEDDFVGMGSGVVLVVLASLVGGIASLVSATSRPEVSV